MESRSQDDEDVDLRHGDSNRLREVAALLGVVASTSVEIEKLRRKHDEAALLAREHGATWTQIGRAAGISAPSAQRRWDPTSKQRHRDYQRGRVQRVQATS